MNTPVVGSKPTWTVCSKLRGGEIAYCEFSRGMVKANMDSVFKVEGWGDCLL